MDLLTDLINNEKIIELLDFQHEKYIKDEPDSLIYLGIFPYLKVKMTQTIANCYIMLAQDITNINRNNPTYATYRTTIWVMSHIERMKVKGKNGCRIDLLAEEIKKQFDGQHKFGFSEFEMTNNRELILDETYLYRELIFVCNDLRKPITNAPR